MIRRLIAPAALLLLACLLVSAEGCKRRPPIAGPAVAIRNAQGQEWIVAVELALTPQEHAKGLMYRWSLQPDHGMLFIFDDVKQRRFWMKNTRIPLDMIFIRPDLTILGIVENAEPYTETERFVPGVSAYVLEVGGGECARHGIKAGDRVTFYNLGVHAAARSGSTDKNRRAGAER